MFLIPWRIPGCRHDSVMLCATEGHAIAQVVSYWLPTAVAWVPAQVWSCGICVGQSGGGEGFLQVLQFLLPSLIPPTAPQSPSSVIWGWYNRPVVAAVPGGLSLTPLRRIICSRELNEFHYMICLRNKCAHFLAFALQIMKKC
jgi:hypothetical protein